MNSLMKTLIPNSYCISMHWTSNAFRCKYKGSSIALFVSIEFLNKDSHMNKILNKISIINGKRQRHKSKRLLGKATYSHRMEPDTYVLEY